MTTKRMRRRLARMYRGPGRRNAVRVDYSDAYAHVRYERSSLLMRAVHDPRGFQESRP